MSDLKAELEKRGLSVDGKKPDLVNRLQARLDEEEFGLVPAFGGTDADSPKGAATAATVPVPVTVPPPETIEAVVKSPSEEVLKSQSAKPEATSPDPPPAASQSKPNLAKPGPATTDPETSQNTQTVDLKAKGKELTFEEKLKLRAERFQLPAIKADDESKGKRGPIAGATRGGKKAKVDDDTVPPPPLSADELEKRKKREARFGTVNASEGVAMGTRKSTRVAIGKPGEDTPLLSKEEILRQLERAKKYQISNAKTEELKAMLRKYRFEDGE